MKLFNCQHCGQMLFFENITCGKCSHRLGYLPELGTGTLSAVEPDGNHWRALAPEAQGSFRFCANAEYEACNWLVPASSSEIFCKACRHNRTIPDLSPSGNLEQWRKVEIAKRRLFYTLIRLRLPLLTRTEDPEHGLAFDFLEDPPASSSQKVLTGHDNGLITLAMKEADDAEREKMRAEMGEPYRTLLGHFRHEVGHHFWDVLVRDGGQLEACRAVFGDDSQDYEEALKRHYEEGPPPDWCNDYISAYATTHPWEDFAETWAHYLHITDTLETASTYGLRIHPQADKTGLLDARIDFDPHEAPDIETIVDGWVPLTFAMNSLNRSMGLQDPYPFVLSPTVIGKLRFIHQLVHERHGSQRPSD
jgi:hypothetical protein